MGRELGPGALTTGAGGGGVLGGARRGRKDTAASEGWEHGGWSLVCSKRHSWRCGERAKPTCWKLWCPVLPDRSWVQEEATPLPNQGKRKICFLSPWGMSCRELMWPE